MIRGVSPTGRIMLVKMTADNIHIDYSVNNRL